MENRRIASIWSTLSCERRRHPASAFHRVTDHFSSRSVSAGPHARLRMDARRSQTSNKLEAEKSMKGVRLGGRRRGNLNLTFLIFITSLSDRSVSPWSDKRWRMLWQRVQLPLQLPAG